MPLQADKPGRIRLGNKLFVQLRVTGYKRRIHQRAVLRHNRPLEQFRAVEEIIKHLCFAFVALLHLLKTADLVFDPLQNQLADVD